MAEISINIPTDDEHCGDCEYWSDTDGWICELFHRYVSPSNPGRTEFARCVECHQAEIRVTGRQAQLAGQRKLLDEQDECIRQLEENETR